jgi:hypothetical protein
MSHSFDVRFARSTGFVAWLQASPNRLRWKGAGRLSIDAEGISIAVKRGLTTLFAPRSRRISAHDLTEVYREADALRLEFNAADSREVLPLWASGSDAAAEIVKLLPTQRTVELEHSTARPPPYRLDWSAVGWLVIAGLALAALVSALQRLYAPPDVPSTPAPRTRVESVPSPESARPSIAIENAPVVEPEFPMARSSPAYGAARRHLDEFEVKRAALYAEFLKLRGSPSPVELEALRGRWTSLVQQIRDAPGYTGAELEKLRLMQYAVCLGWRNFLSMYAEGLRMWNSQLTTASFVEREKAETALERLRWYVP